MTSPRFSDPSVLLKQLDAYDERSIPVAAAALFLGVSERTLYRLPIRHTMVGKRRTYSLGELRLYRELNSHGRTTARGR
jgi:hypothetical protein